MDGTGTSPVTVLKRLWPYIRPLIGIVLLAVMTMGVVAATEAGIPALRNSVSAMLPNARHVEGNIFGSIGSGLAIEARKRYGVA